MFIIESKTKEGFDTFIQKWKSSHTDFLVDIKYVSIDSFPNRFGAFVDSKKKVITVQPIGLTHVTD